jgi:hypothetical protein
MVVFVHKTSSTSVATWSWQSEGRSAECVILGVRLSGSILLEFRSPSRRIFIGSHSLPPLWSPIGPSPLNLGVTPGMKLLQLQCTLPHNSRETLPFS